MEKSRLFYEEKEFKDTEIGKVPRDWNIARLQDVAEIRANKNVNNLDKIAFIPMEAIPDAEVFAKYHVRAKGEIKSSTYCEAGDLLLAKITPSLENGKQGIVPFDVPNKLALASTEVFPICCKQIDRFFLFYILKFSKFRNKIIASMTGTTGRQRATKESVEKLTIPLPPVNEQQQIASILLVIDQAIQKTDEVIAKTERLKKGMMQELLTKGTGHKEFKDTEIGKIPREWEVVRFEDICEKIKSGGTPITSKKEYYDGDIPFVKIEDITTAGKYLSSTTTTITKEGLNNSTAWLVPRNSLLIAIYGSLGSVAINTIEIATNQAILGIILKERAETEFFYYIFSSFNLSKYAKRTTQANLTAEIIKNLKVPLPPPSEQKRIVSILSTVDRKLELERNEKSRLERIKKGFMYKLLTGKIRVRVEN